MLFGKDGRSKEARNIKKATSGIIKANKSKKKSSSISNKGESSFFGRLIWILFRWCCIFPFAIYVLKSFKLLVMRGPRFVLLYLKYKISASFFYVVMDGDYHDDFEDWLEENKLKLNI